MSGSPPRSQGESTQGASREPGGGGRWSPLQLDPTQPHLEEPLPTGHIHPPPLQDQRPRLRSGCLQEHSFPRRNGCCVQHHPIDYFPSALKKRAVGRGASGVGSGWQGPPGQTAGGQGAEGGPQGPRPRPHIAGNRRSPHISSLPRPVPGTIPTPLLPPGRCCCLQPPSTPAASVQDPQSHSSPQPCWDWCRPPQGHIPQNTLCPPVTPCQAGPRPRDQLALSQHARDLAEAAFSFFAFIFVFHYLRKTWVFPP